MTENNDEKKNAAKQEKDEKMALKFPDWDLTPPNLLVNREKMNESSK
ncbi:MAG: hypothetical protein LBN20_04215 [Endomicrobium sp.]|jgi:hypothetical protein|nr:hypothetical protein [Endomicrobium sp.]